MSMTNEKAVDLLRRMQEPEAYEPPITEEAFEALEMAIRALGTDTNVGTKDVPDINVGDMISRQAVLDIAFKYCPDDDGVCSEVGSDLRNMLDEIENLPPAEPKRGKWIEDKGQKTLMQNFIERGEVWRVCSVCGAGHMIGHKYESDKAYHETHHNFCPKCGAKMEGAS